VEQIAAGNNPRKKRTEWDAIIISKSILLA
jgi:hypothetical protein